MKTISLLSLSLILMLCHEEGMAQACTSHFSALSKDTYQDRAAMLKGRKVPVVFTAKKEQAAYAEIIKERNERLREDVVKNRLVYDTMLLNKSNAIIQRMKAANLSYSFDSISLFIDRSPVPNASCFGEGTLYINAGLFLIIDNDDELALVLGHELAHQFLKHSEKHLKKYISVLASDDFREEMRSIKRSSEGKYERYRELMKGIATQNGKHSRFGETEADSLGAALIKNAGYDVKKAALILLKLDNAEDLFTGAGLYNVRAAFGLPDSATVKKRRYNGLSMETVTMNANKDVDSVKTHPDCELRYAALSKDYELKQADCCKKITSYQRNIKERALTELIRDAYENNQFTFCSHLCLFALNNGFTDPFYSAFLSLSFSGIAEAERKLARFTVTNAGGKAGSTLKEIQDLIFNYNSEAVYNASAYFLQKTGGNCEDAAFAQLMYDTKVKTGNEAQLQKNFISAYPKSKYHYLITTKTEK